MTYYVAWIIQCGRLRWIVYEIKVKVKVKGKVKVVVLSFDLKLTLDHDFTIITVIVSPGYDWYYFNIYNCIQVHIPPRISFFFGVSYGSAGITLHLIAIQREVASSVVVIGNLRTLLAKRQIDICRNIMILSHEAHIKHTLV